MIIAMLNEALLLSFENNHVIRNIDFVRSYTSSN